jgi:hypothetical protein
VGAIMALLSLADSALKFATVKEANNPVWLKERNKLLDIKTRYMNEYKKGEDNWDTSLLDDIRSELLLLAEANATALAAAHG